MHTRQVSFRIQGMNCARCAVELEERLEAAEGVFAAYVNYASERALIVYDAECVDAQGLTDAIESAGYAVLPEDKIVLKRERAATRLFRVMRKRWGVHAQTSLLRK